MVTVTQRPLGIKIIDQAISAVIGTSVGGNALVTLVGHSLFTGSYVFIESDIDEYNGMWYVTEITTATFAISPNASSPFVLYYQDANITYYQSQTHVWSSAFLPIVYKASNNRWPLNTVDAVANVTSQADDNGFTRLNVSVDPGVIDLEYVTVTGHGVYQVVDWNTGYITINLAYDAANVFTTAQKYYNSYQVKVNIYGGLEIGEYWEGQKPFRLLGTLSLTPDASNNVMFSISEYVRGLIAIKNNPILYSMPLNLDAFTAFYIETAEAFDSSDSYSVITSESSYTTDDFIGYAVAGKLPFKNRYSGFYSEYVYTSGSPALWLNTLTTLIGVVDNYFDLSFIKNIAGAIQIYIAKYANDYLYETQIVDYADFGKGVYRIPLTFSSEYDQYCVTAYRAEVAARPASNITMLSMTNCAGGTWTEPNPPTTNEPVITLGGSGGDSGYVSRAYATNGGVEYSFSYEITVNSSAGTVLSRVYMALMDDDCNVIVSDSNNHITAGGVTGIITGTILLTPGANGTRLGLRIVNNSIPYTKTFRITDLDFNGSAAQPAFAITEEVCIDIYEVCGFDDGAVIQPTGARRLLEDGGFRLLED